VGVFLVMMLCIVWADPTSSTDNIVSEEVCKSNEAVCTPCSTQDLSQFKDQCSFSGFIKKYECVLTKTSVSSDSDLDQETAATVSSEVTPFFTLVKVY
jgi:hypothetical protein